MKLHRYIGKFNFSSKIVEITDAAIVHQLKKVLRTQQGDKFVLCDGNSNEALVVVRKLENHSLIVDVEKTYKNTNEPQKKVSLYCAILKRDNFEFVVQKATEIGIMEIIPLITRRTIKQKVNIERLTTIAKEAAEQSGRGIVPAIKAPVPFANVEKSELEKKTTIFFHTNESARTLDEITSSQGELNIFIGPEGGWDETEVKFAMAHNFYLASLGKLILRAETAAIIASYLAVHLS